MHKLLCRAIFVVALFSIAGTARSQSWQELLAQAETLAEAGQADSAQAIFEQAVHTAETQYSRSNSTTNLVFLEEGMPLRRYFESHTKAHEIFETLLSGARRIHTEDDPEVIQLEIKLGEAYLEGDRSADAAPLFDSAIEKRKKQFGDNSLKVAEVILQRGRAAYFLTQYVESEELFSRALAMATETGGNNHPLVAQCRYYLANQWRYRGPCHAADSLFEAAVATADSVYSSDPLERARFIEMKGRIKYCLKDYAKAKEAFENSLKIWRDRLGNLSETVATTLTRLGNVNAFLDDYAQAESCYTEALAIQRESFGSQSTEVANTIGSLAWLYHYSYEDLVGAESLYAQAARTIEEALGPDNSDHVFYLEKLAWVMYNRGRFMDALPVFQRNLECRMRLYGENSRQSVVALRGLGTVNMRLGSFADAESYLKRALSMADSVLGPDDHYRMRIIHTLALNYDGQGRCEEAAELYRQKVAFEEKNLDPDDPDRGHAFVDLGMAYWSMGRLDDAEANLLMAVSVFEPLAEEQAYGLGIALLNLGLTYESQHRYKEADSVLSKSIEIGETAFGPQHPALAHALNNLSNLYMRLGRYNEAESLQLRAVDILEGALGQEHPEVAKFRRDLGRLYAYAGKSTESLDSYERFIGWSQRFLENVFPYSSEGQKLTWMREYPIVDHTAFSLALSAGSVRSREVAMEMLLKSKAMVVEAIMSERKAAYCIRDDTIEAQLRELGELHSLIASLSMAGGSFSDSLNGLYQLKDSLEVQISSHCSEFGDALAARRFDLSDISNALPATGVLWEFVRFEPRNLDPAIAGDDKLQPERYMAFTVGHSGNITARDLGEAAHIDSLVVYARELLYKAQGQIYSVAAVTAEERLSEVTRQLYDLIFAPLASVSDGESQIYIAPDGLLNLIPFEILTTPDGSYVIENYNISYLSSGRDLLKIKDASQPDGEMLLVADPDFDNVGADSGDKDAASVTIASISTEMYGPQFRGIVDCLKSDFPRLGHTRSEARSVAAQVTESTDLLARELYGVEAAEGSLKSLTKSPRIVHLATHGFFCESADTASTSLRDNPLLRSGLALAGANRTIAGEREESETTEDGILTALEVSGLNLIGTELAVLSACESGVGDLVNGEGVFGLRRAFQHAGAQTVIISLWPIPDRETSQLMDGFYRRWLDGMTKRDALRESAISVLSESRQKRGCGHPLLWGGFILTGNPN